MTFVWNRQLVSSLILVGLVMVLGSRSLQAQGQEPKLSWGAERVPSPEENNWLQKDRSWLSGLPAARKEILPIDPFSVGQDSLVALRRWVEAGAGTDSLSRRRPLASLLRDRWSDRGYLGAEVTGTDSLVVLPGPRYHWGKIQITGEDFPGRRQLLKTWLPRGGEVFDRKRLDRSINRLLQGAGESGHPFARWVTTDLQLDPAQGLVDLEGRLLPGYQVVVGQISSPLASPRASRFLARTTGLRQGALLKNSDLVQARDRLLARDLYSYVGDPQVYLTASHDTVGIHFPVVPRRKVNRFQVVLGLSRREEGQPGRLSGDVALDLPNLAGTGRHLTAGWRDDGVDKSWFGLSFREPLAFGTPLDMDLILDNEAQTDSYTRIRLDNRWRIPVVSLWGVEGGIGWDRTTFTSGSLANTSRLRGRGALLRHRGDRTRSGWSGVFALETAHRASVLKADSQGDGSSNPGLGEDVTQRIVSGDLAGEIYLGSSFSIFARGSFRQLSGKEKEAPLSEQFNFGGASSLRGYRENEFHGTTAWWTGWEARIGRLGASRLYTFYDLGYFEFSAAVAGGTDPGARTLKKGWARGYGLGLLARTTGGDISLAIGFPGTVDFNRAKLHVTLLESF